MTDGGEEANKFLESADLPVFNVVASAIDVSAPTAPWPAQPADFLAVAYTKELGKYRTKTLKEIKSNVGKQRAAASLFRIQRSNGWLARPRFGAAQFCRVHWLRHISHHLSPIGRNGEAPSESRAADLCAVLSHHITTPHHKRRPLLLIPVLRGLFASVRRRSSLITVPLTGVRGMGWEPASDAMWTVRISNPGLLYLVLLACATCLHHCTLSSVLLQQVEPALMLTVPPLIARWAAALKMKTALLSRSGSRACFPHGNGQG